MCVSFNGTSLQLLRHGEHAGAPAPPTVHATAHTPSIVYHQLTHRHIISGVPLYILLTIRMYLYSGTEGKRRLAGTGNATCTGTYSDRYRVLDVSMGRWTSAGVPPPGAGHTPVHTPSISTAGWCAGTTFVVVRILNVHFPVHQHMST